MIRPGVTLALLFLAARAAACEPPGPGLVVSPAGNDDAAGTAARPFRSLARALAATRDGAARTIWVDGGVYALAAPLALDGRDDGLALRACPGRSPALDGGSASLDTLLRATGTDGITVAGLTFSHTNGPALVLQDGEGAQVADNLFTDVGIGILLIGGRGQTVCANRVLHAEATGIEAKDGVSQLAIAGNDIDGTGAPTTHGGGIFVHGSQGVTIVQNRVRHTRGMGIGVANWDETTQNRDFTIAGNVVQATNRDAEDSGAIYVLGRSHLDLRARIVGNLVEDAGLAGDAHTIGVYLDDSASGVVVAGNTLRAPFTHAVQIHGGDDILIENNLIDLDPAATSAVLFQAAPADTSPLNTMRDNRVQRNIIRMDGSARPTTTSIEGGAPTVAGNLVVRSFESRIGEEIGADLVLAARPAVGMGPLIEIAGSLIGFGGVRTSALGPTPGLDCSNSKTSGTNPE